MLDAQRLSDRIEIDDLLTSYTVAVDTGDWDRLQSYLVTKLHSLCLVVFCFCVKGGSGAGKSSTYKSCFCKCREIKHLRKLL